MKALQWVNALKAIVSSWYLPNYRSLFNLRYLIRWWCNATHTFFLSCCKITVTLEDVANQLLLPILGGTDPNNIKLSAEEEAVEAELKKGVNGNAKLSYWVGAFSEASTVVHCASFVTFWLYKFVFGLYLHYVVKPLLLLVSHKDFCGVSLPLALMFLGHLYIQLDIL